METDTQLQLDVCAELKWESAIYAAWNMPGVGSVVDHMALTF